MCRRKDCGIIENITSSERTTWGSSPSPWNLKMMTSYAVSVQNTLKFSLAPSALASNTLKLSLKRWKKSQNVSFVPSARRKIGHFCQSMRFCPPLEKFLRAPMDWRRVSNAQDTSSAHWCHLKYTKFSDPDNFDTLRACFRRYHSPRLLVALISLVRATTLQV